MNQSIKSPTKIGYQAQIIHEPISIKKSLNKRKNQRFVLNLKALKSKSPREAYWLFTGRGGLHSFKRNQFKSFEDYTRAKQKKEVAMFLTPDEVARLAVEMLEIEKGSTVCDIACGKGTFFNYVSPECKLYGVEKEKDACTIARTAFPKADIQFTDMQYMKPIPKCDFILGNPPFDLVIYDPKHPFSFRDGKVLSQNLHLGLCHKYLKKGGFLGLVVPYFHTPKVMTANCKTQKFFWDNFNVVATISLPKGTFSECGTNVETKLLIVQKKYCNGKLRIPYFQTKYTNREQVLKEWRKSPQYGVFQRLKKLKT